jgi:cysteine protease ATG4
MANVDFAGQYKRIMRFFWDPEPKNDDLSPAPIWCLGIEYPSHNDKTKEVVESKQVEVVQTNTEENDIDQETVVVANRNASISHLNETDRGREVMIVPSHVSPDEENGWPPSFLDDFEARFWFTYRSHFAPIRNSTEQNAHASLSLAVRLRSQLVEQSGFTSDTGWGCMIRSGQCLIGNALQILRFGRGMRTSRRKGQS